MLLEQVVAELSERNSNWRLSTEGYRSEEMDEGVSRELELHLESEREFFKRLAGKKELRTTSDSSSSGWFRPCISIPFQWEEKPGKPRSYPSCLQHSPSLLALPMTMPYNSIDAHFLGISPRPLSSRLRNCIEDRGGGSQWRASPSPTHDRHSSTANRCTRLIAYCNTKTNSEDGRDCVHVLLANRLVSVSDLLNAVPVENYEFPSQSHSKNTKQQQLLEYPKCISRSRNKSTSVSGSVNALVPVEGGGGKAVSREDDETSTSVSDESRKFGSLLSWSTHKSSSLSSDSSSADTASSHVHVHVPRKTYNPLDRKQESSLTKLIDNNKKCPTKPPHSLCNRWPHFKRRMKIGCCPFTVEDTVSSSISKSAAQGMKSNKQRERKMIVNQHKIHVEWTKLVERDELQK